MCFHALAVAIRTERIERLAQWHDTQSPGPNLDGAMNYELPKPTGKKGVRKIEMQLGVTKLPFVISVNNAAETPLNLVQR